MTAAVRAILDELTRLGASLRPDGDLLRLRAGDVAIPGELVERVRAAKPELLTLLARPEPGFELPCFARRGRIVFRSDELFLHFCCECGAWGSFGYGLRLREGQPGRWYCAGHRPKACAARL